MGTMKDTKGMNLTEVGEIKKRWQEYTELYEKALNDPDNHDGVITHLESDILECEVKGALVSISKDKASGCHHKVYKQSMLERVWRKGNPLTLLVGMQTSTATMENNVEFP